MFESDDWGTIRTSSRQAYNQLVKLGYKMNGSPFSKDALETEEDLDDLFTILESIKDHYNRPACFTANMIVANPDFEMIRNSNYEEFFYEPVNISMKNQPNRKDVISKWLKGLTHNIFIPQFHSLIHIRWWDWLKALRNSSKEALLTFNFKMCGVPLKVSRENQSFYTPIYLEKDELHRNGINIETIISDGISLFQNLFGYQSLSTVAPNYCWTNEVERIWKHLGIKFIQGDIFQYVGNTREKRPHFMGEKNSTSSFYMVRNCEFEPSSDPANCINRCLYEINLAFRFKKPAIICTHRVNYIGSIFPENRETSLKLLNQLLKSIVSRWPDVIFMSSPELGNLMQKKLSH